MRRALWYLRSDLTFWHEFRRRAEPLLIAITTIECIEQIRAQHLRAILLICELNRVPLLHTREDGADILLIGEWELIVRVIIRVARLHLFQYLRQALVHRLRFFRH